MSGQQHAFMGVAVITVASLLPTSALTHCVFPPATINKPSSSLAQEIPSLFTIPPTPHFFSSLSSFSLQWIYSIILFMVSCPWSSSNYCFRFVFNLLCSHILCLICQQTVKLVLKMYSQNPTTYHYFTRIILQWAILSR